MPSSETFPLISSGPRQKSPLPSLYYHFFSKVEPLGLLGGAAWAILFPTSFFKAYLGDGYNDTLDKTGGHRGQLVASGMGSCMLIIGITSLVLVPTLNRVLKPYPALLEKCIRSQLFCLAIGDVAHIAVTLFYLPGAIRWNLSAWTLLVWGNVAGTAMPAVVRLLWFFGVGRDSYTNTKTETEGLIRND